MPTSLTDCQNCSQRFEAHYPYCPYCGMKSNDELTIGVLFSNTISNYFSVDARFFKSIFPLMLRPGYLAKRFVQGQRIQYLHPAQMYLFVSVVFFFVFSFISRDQVEDLDNQIDEPKFQNSKVVDSIPKFDNSLKMENIQKKSSLPQLPVADSLSNRPVIYQSDDNDLMDFDFEEETVDSLIASGATNEIIYKEMGMKDDAGYFQRRLYAQILKTYKKRNGASFLEAFYDSIPLAMFLLLPLFALILKLFYFRKGRFSHHLVFTFYFFSFLFIVFSLLILATLIWKEFPGWVIGLTMFSTFFYLVLGIRRFYQQGRFLSLVKSGIISLLFLLLVLPIAALLVGFITFMFY